MGPNEIRDRHRPAYRIQQKLDAVEDRSEDSMVEALADAIREERAALGKAGVPMSEVRRAERRAAGHCDYSRQVAFIGEQLVLGE